MPVYYPHELIPDIRCYFSSIPDRDYWLQNVPIVWPTVADESNLKTSDSSNGRFIPHTGHTKGAWLPKRQDTYEFGTASRTGEAFDVTSGTWSSNWVTAYQHTYGMLMSDQTLASGGILIQHTSTDKIADCQIVLGRGHLPPVSAASHTYSSTDTYCYIYLAYGSSLDFRIVVEHGNPVAIDRTVDGWVSYSRVGQSDKHGDPNSVLQRSNRDLTFNIHTDYNENTIDVETNDGYKMHTTMGGAFSYDVAGKLTKYPPPDFGRIRLVTANSYTSFEYYPLRYQNISDTRQVESPRVSDHPNFNSGVVATNARTTANPSQTVSATLTKDVFGRTIVGVAITGLDAGDGLGSADPTTLVDATIIIPAYWTQGIDGINDSFPYYARVINMDVVQNFDDVSRMVTSSCHLTLDNHDNQMTRFWGNRAVDIWAGTGNGNYKVFTGIAGDDDNGWTLYRENTLGRVRVECYDFSKKMMQPIGQRLILDGMCIYNAVRLIAELSSIHPMYMLNLPTYIPPGCNVDAPYGPAGEDCPYPILAKGSGLNARYEFAPEVTAWQIFQLLVQDSGYVDPITGTNIPFYGGFDVTGQVIFSAYDPSQLGISAIYQQRDDTGLSQLEGISVDYSVSGMRTDVDFIGLDPWTYLLQHVHLRNNIQTLLACGYLKKWIERNPRYSGDYLLSAAYTALAMSGIPTIIPHIQVPFLPYVYGGHRVLIQDDNTLGFILDGYIIQLHTEIGMADGNGQQSGYEVARSHATIRAIANAPHLG